MVFLRLVLPILRLLAQLGYSSFLISLPPEIQDPKTLANLEGLNFYLSLYEQDPGWVTFIQQELNHNTPLEDILGRLRMFHLEERTSSLRCDLIQEFLSLYERNGAFLPVEPYLLEQALRSYLDHIHATDSFTVLQASYQDLRENEGGSVFFTDVVSHNRDFLEAQSTSRRLIEEGRRMQWEQIDLEIEKRDKAEFQHALLYLEISERGIC